MGERAKRRLSKRALFAHLGYEPHPGQKVIHESRAPRRVVACGSRFGKSVCAAMEGLAAAMQPAEHSVGWVVAPTYDLSERVFNQAAVVAASHLRHRIVSLKENERRLVIRNMGGGLSEIRGKSADNPISLLGEGLDWVIVDEASRLKPSIWENYLSQRLIDKEGWALLISTPKGKGYFFDLYKRGQNVDPDYQSWNMPSWANPLLDREVIEQERERLPERVFRQEFGAEFIEGSGAVFRNVREAATGILQDPQRGEIYVGGLDLAKVEDFTVLVILNRKREVVFVDRFHRLDWSVQVARIKAATERYDDVTLRVDSTGAGEPVYESLRQAGVQARAYAFTQASKSALVNNLALMFERSEIVLPRPDLWPEGIDELEAFEYSVTDAGAVRTSAPSGVHDDCVVALALAAWDARSPIVVAHVGAAAGPGYQLGSRIRIG
jgi:hypothetical protein